MNFIPLYGGKKSNHTALEHSCPWNFPFPITYRLIVIQGANVRIFGGTCNIKVCQYQSKFRNEKQSSIIRIASQHQFKLTPQRYEKVLNYAIPWRTCLRGAAQLFSFAYASAWNRLRIYIHFSCNTTAFRRESQALRYSITVYENEIPRLRRNVNINIYYIYSIIISNTFSWGWEIKKITVIL